MEHLFSFGILAPPTIFIVLNLLGALLALRWRRLGLAVAIISSVSLYALATPALSSSLLRIAEGGVSAPVDFGMAQAIVVLGGDVRPGNGSDIPDELGAMSLERLAYAAAAWRRLHLPVLVSGGRLPEMHVSEATLMKQALEQDFAVPVAWSEEDSRTTWENAAFSARLLEQEQVRTVIVVSHAWHVPRAVWAFERHGLTALPWPASRTPPRLDRVKDFLPSIGALENSFRGLHELIGGIYYRLRH